MEIKDWWFYDKQSGVFNGCKFTGSADDLEKNMLVGCGAISGVSNWKKQKVDTQAITATVVEYAQPLTETKRNKKAEMKAEQALRIAAAGSTPIGVFQADPMSLANITSVVVGLVVHPNVPLVRFTLADNTRPTFSREAFLAAATKIMAAVQGIYDVADTLRGQIDACTTNAEVEAVVWPG